MCFTLIVLRQRITVLCGIIHSHLCFWTRLVRDSAFKLTIGTRLASTMLSGMSCSKPKKKAFLNRVFPFWQGRGYFDAGTASSGHGWTNQRKDVHPEAHI